MSMTVIRHGAAASPPQATTHHAVAVRGSGTGVVSASWPLEGIRQIVGIERFANLDAVVDRIRKLKATDPDCQIVIDAERGGDALWELLGHRPRRRVRGWSLYEAHGRDRQELTRVLRVAFGRRSFTFAPGLREQQALNKALLHIERDVNEEGPDSELAVALSLALDDHQPPRPRIG